MADENEIPETSAEVGATPTAIDSSLAEPAAAPVNDADAVEEPVAAAPATDLLFTTTEKAKIRANIRWIMAEIDYGRSGRRAEERETLNP